MFHPRFHPDTELHRSLAHCELSGKGSNESASPIFFASLTNHFPSQFMSRIIFASLRAISSSPLFVAIAHIIRLCAKPKVVRVDAGRVISFGTVVEYKQSFGNRTVVKYPRSNRRSNRATMFESSVDLPVAVDVLRTRPQPTGFGLFHLCPKSLWEGLGKSLRSKVINGNLDHSQFANAAWVTGPAAFSFYQFSMKPST